MPGMTYLRLLGAVCLLMLMLTATWADTPTSHMLSPERFRGWVTLRSENSDDLISQVWRQSIVNLPKGADGYLMASYQVEHLRSAAQMKERIGAIATQLNTYIAQGYSVTKTPWVVQGQQGIKSTVRGLSHGTVDARAHRAELFTMVLPRDDYIIWLEVRQASSAKDLATADKSLLHADGEQLAEQLLLDVLSLWTPRAPEPPLPEIVIPPVTPSLEVATPPDTKIASIPDAASPSTPTLAAVPTTPTVPETMPVAPTQAVVQAPQNAPPAASVPVAVTPPAPVIPEKPRWQVAGGAFSLLLPEKWTVSGKGPYTISDGKDDGITLRLYPSEPYTGEQDLTAALKYFVETQRDIALKSFAYQPYEIDGARGVQVNYTNHAHRTSYGYYYGKTGRLWRIDVDIPGDDTPMPTTVTTLLNSVRIP